MFFCLVQSYDKNIESESVEFEKIGNLEDKAPFYLYCAILIYHAIDYFKYNDYLCIPKCWYI